MARGARVQVAGNISQVRAEVRRVRAALRAEVKALPAKVAPEVLGMVIVGIRRGVYDTAPGQYRRTGELLQGIQVRPMGARGDVAGVQVGNEAPHASFVEFGRQGSGGVSEAVAVAQAEALGGSPAPLYMGRTGANWQRANPAVTRATVYAGALMGRQLQAALREQWRQAGRNAGRTG